MRGKTAICLLVLCVFLCGCSTTEPEKTGSVKVTSLPSAAEVYLDNEYRGTTPATINEVTAGNHTVEIRLGGYENWSESIRVISAGTLNVSASLKPVVIPVPATVPVTPSVTMKKEVPEIHVDGYWTYPAQRSYSNPIPIFVHAQAANVGSGDARVVTSSANLYYFDQQVCWVKIYFGTIKAGGHAAKDTMMSCSLPSGADDHDFIIKFENIVVTP